MTVISLYKPGFCGYLYFFWLGTSVECLGHVTGSCLTPSNTVAPFPKAYLCLLSITAALEPLASPRLPTFGSFCLLTWSSYSQCCSHWPQTPGLQSSSLSLQRSEEERHVHHALALPDGVVLFLKDILVDTLAIDFFCSCCFGLFV